MILLKVLGLGSLFIAGLLGVFGVCFITCLVVNAFSGRESNKDNRGRRKLRRGLITNG